MDKNKKQHDAFLAEFTCGVLADNHTYNAHSGNTESEIMDAKHFANTDSEIMHAEAGFNIQGPEAGIHSARWALLRPFVAEASVPTDNQPLPLHDEADHHSVLGREQPISFSLPGVYHFAVDLQVVPPPLCVMSFGS